MGHVVAPGLLRVSLSSPISLTTDVSTLLFHVQFSVLGASPRPPVLANVRLNDLGGRDFVTSALQREIEIGRVYQTYLPVVRVVRRK